jgi:hypothetical protein
MGLAGCLILFLTCNLLLFYVLRATSLQNNRIFSKNPVSHSGCTTNGKGLATFKPGGFRPLLPVQPVSIKYPYVHYDGSWADPAAPSILFLAFRMMTQVSFRRTFACFFQPFGQGECKARRSQAFVRGRPKVDAFAMLKGSGEAPRALL